MYMELGLEPIDQDEDLWWIFHLHDMRGTAIYSASTSVLRFTKAVIIGEQMDNHRKPETFQMLLHDTEYDAYLEMFRPGDAPVFYLGIKARHMLPSDSPSASLYADMFIRYGKLLYEVFHPIYAYAENLSTVVDRESVEQYLLTHVFWAQCFGPGFMNEVGDEVLRNAPAWRSEGLNDGGLLYVLAASPYLFHGIRQYWQTSREYFQKHGLVSIQWADQAR